MDSVIARLRRFFGVESDRVSAIWLAEHARRGNRIEFHGSGKPWRFSRFDMDAAWRNRYRLRNETQEQERRRA